MSQYKFIKATDTEHEITLASHIVFAAWQQACAHPGDSVTAALGTAFVGDGAPVEITVKTRQGKTVVKKKGEMRGDAFRAEVKVPFKVKAGEALQFEVKLARNGLQAKSTFIPVILAPRLKSLKWGAEVVHRHELVTLSAELENVPDDAPAVFSIYEHDQDGAHDRIVDLTALVAGGKADLEWLYAFQDDTDDVATQAELEEHGGNYNPPEYFFTVRVGGKELGTAQESGLLRFSDSLEVSVTDAEGEPVADEQCTLHLPDGSQRDATTDSGGNLQEEDVPPGPIEVEFPNLELVRRGEQARRARGKGAGAGSKYTLQPDETLLGVCRQYGVPDWQAAYDHSKNAELKSVRGSHENLKAGDTLWLPGVELNKPVVASGAPAELKTPGPVEKEILDWHLVMQCAHRIDVWEIPGKKDPRPRVVEDVSDFQVVGTADEVVKVLYRNDAQEPPEVLAYGAKSVTASGWEADGEHRRYELSVPFRHTGVEDILKKKFWTQMKEPTVYPLSGLPAPREIRSYYPHKWEFSISLPTLAGCKGGAKFGGNLREKGGESLELSGKVWDVKNRETHEGKLETGKKPKGETNKNAYVDAVEIKKDGNAISCNVLDVLNPALEYVELITDLIDLIIHFAPQVGWCFDFEIGLLQGKFQTELQWKEYDDHRAYFALGLTAEISLFKLALTLGFGIQHAALTAQVFVTIAGEIKVSGSWERISPDDDGEYAVGIAGEIPGEAGVRAEAGGIVKIKLAINTGFETSGQLKYGTNDGFGIEADCAFKPWAATFDFSVGRGGKFGYSTSPRWEFIPKYDIGKFEWPSPKKYEASYLSDDEVRKILNRFFTEGWNIRVFTLSGSAWSRDTRWTMDQIVEPIIDAMGRHKYLRRSTKSVESLAYRIRKRLEVMGKRTLRDWVNAEDYREFTEDGELDELLVDLIDDAAVIAAQLEEGEGS